MSLPQFLCNSVKKNMPEMNLRLARGLAQPALDQAPLFIKQLAELIAKDFPPGITFERISFCSPEKEYEKLSEIKSGSGNGRRGGKKSKKPSTGGFNFAKSDFYLMELVFSDNGKPIHTHLCVPFAREGGWLWVKDSQREIHPACCDTVISVDNSGVFIKLHRDKFKISRHVHPLAVNDRLTAYPVLWSKIHKAKPAMDKTVPFSNLSHSIPHYLFAKFGFHETFERFLGFRPIVGMSEINTENYPTDKYAIFSSGTLQMRVNGVRQKRRKTGPGTHVRFAVPIEYMRSNKASLVYSLITGYYYVADHFPDDFPADGLYRGRWAIKLGYLITGENLSGVMLEDKCNEHLRSSLDTCLDSIIVRKLANNDIHVETIYDLFIAVIEKYPDWTSNGLEMAMTMYGKEFSVLYYALENVIHALTNTFFELNKLHSRQNRELREGEVAAAIQRRINIQSTTPFKSRRMGGKNSASKILNSASYPGDNWALKVSSAIIPQSKFEGGNQSILTNPATQMHISVIECGNFGAMTKGASDGRGRANLCVKTDEHDRIVRNQDLIALTEWVQSIIKRN